ncbi:MAG: hypothetical protein C4527_24480, partial [Candidatus Omnitrophota bacterium]
MDYSLLKIFLGALSWWRSPTIPATGYAAGAILYTVPQNLDRDLRWETSKPKTRKRGELNDKNAQKFRWISESESGLGGDERGKNPCLRSPASIKSMSIKFANGNTEYWKNCPACFPG